MRESLEDKPAQTMATAPSSGHRQTVSAQHREGHQHERPDSDRSTTELKAASATPLTLGDMPAPALSDRAEREKANEMMLFAIDRILENPSSLYPASTKDLQNIFSMECRRSERTRVDRYLQANSSTGVFYKK